MTADEYPRRTCIPGTCARCGCDVELDPLTLEVCEHCTGKGIDPRDLMECEPCAGTGREYPEDEPVHCGRCAGIEHPSLSNYERNL